MQTSNISNQKTNQTNTSPLKEDGSVEFSSTIRITDKQTGTVLLRIRGDQ